MNKYNIIKILFCVALFLTISFSFSKAFCQDYEGKWCKAECKVGPNYGMHTSCLIIKSYDGSEFQMYLGNSDGSDSWWASFKSIGNGVFEAVLPPGYPQVGKTGQTLTFVTMSKVVFEQRDLRGDIVCKVIYTN